MRVILFEDAAWRRFLPLTSLRSLLDVRCGILPIWKKHALRIGEGSDGIGGLVCRAEMVSNWEGEDPGIPFNEGGEAPALCLNARVLWDSSSLAEARALPPGTSVTAPDGSLLAACGPAGQVSADPTSGPAGRSNSTTTREWPLLSAWYDLLRHNAEEIERDLALLGEAGWEPAGAAIQTQGDQPTMVAGDVTVGPAVTSDTRGGPVIVDAGVELMAAAHLEGPCYVGPGSVVRAGARLYAGCSLGPGCRVGGELLSVLMQGYSNKQHDGYLGNAVVGRWVNLGAATNNSDLKNTYAPITVAVDGEPIPTGMIHLGSCLGDHSKTGIGTMLNTGTVVGIGSNLFGAGYHAVDIPDFVWGGPGDYREHLLEKMLETSRIAMGRRGFEPTGNYEALLRRRFEDSAAEREAFLGRRMHRRDRR